MCVTASHHDYEESRRSTCPQSCNDPERVARLPKELETLFSRPKGLRLDMPHLDSKESQCAACPSSCSDACSYLGCPIVNSRTPPLVHQPVTLPPSFSFGVPYLLRDTSQYQHDSSTAGPFKTLRYSPREPPALMHEIPPLGNLNEIGESCTLCLAGAFQAGQTPACCSQTGCPSPTLQVEDDNPFINTMPCHPILQPSEGISDYPHPVSFDTALTVEDFEENIDLLMSETVTPSEEPFELEFPSLNNPPPGFSHDYS